MNKEDKRFSIMTMHEFGFETREMHDLTGLSITQIKKITNTLDYFKKDKAENPPLELKPRENKSIIWSTMEIHYGKKTTGANLKYTYLTLSPDEKEIFRIISQNEKFKK